MKQLILSLYIIACCTNTLLAQVSFQKTYGGANNDEFRSVCQTMDSGYVIAGWTVSFSQGGDADVYLVKTGSNGDTLWTKTYGGTADDYGMSVQQTLDSGYIIIGYTKSFGAGNNDIYLIKTNAGGDTLWTKTVGGIAQDYGYYVQQTKDNGYIVSGYTTSFGIGITYNPMDKYNAYIIKTDANGDSLWTKAYGGSDYDYGYTIHQTDDGGYIMVGKTKSFGAGQEDVYLIKTNNTGDTLWTKTYGGTNGDIGYSVQQTTDGGYIVAGRTASFGAGQEDVYLIKTDASGDPLWTKTFGGTAGEVALSVEQVADGGYIIAGYTFSFGTAGDVYLIRTNPIGDLLWEKNLGSISADYSFSTHLTTDGGFIIAGSSTGFGNGSLDGYLIKVNAAGEIASVQEEQSKNTFSVSIFPNPAHDAFEYKIESIEKMTIQVKVVDILGQIVINRTENIEKGITSKRMDVSRLCSGTYFLELLSENKERRGKQFQIK